VQQEVEELERGFDRAGASAQPSAQPA
jgi:hypothetical protein